MTDFAPFVIQDCFDIQDEITKQAKAKNIAPDTIDFRIQNYRLYISFEEGSNQPPITLNQNEMKQIDIDAQFNQAKFTIKQACDVRFFPKALQSFVYVELCESKDKVFLRFDDAFVIFQSEEFFADLYNQIESQMAYLGVILRQIPSQREAIARILESIAKDSTKKQERFCIKQTAIFKPHKEARFRFLLRENWEAKNGESPKNAMFGAMIDEVIALYELEDIGKSGRNLLGEYITQEAQPTQTILATNSDEILAKSYPDRIEYISQVQSYIGFKNGEFVIWEDTKEWISTKTASLLDGQKAHIILNIKALDNTKDAIGENMWIEAQTINISGCLAKNTILKAQNLSIDGATHKSSKIYAKQAKILTHKGYLEAQECIIKNLESGIIKADIAKIVRSNGSNVYAKQIYIKTLRTNNTFYFSQNLIIQKNNGTQNELIFSVDGDLKYTTYIQNANAHIESKMQTLEKISHNLKYYATQEQKAKIFFEKLNGFTDAQKKIALQQEAFYQQYNAYSFYTEYAQILKQRIIVLKNHINSIHEKILSLHKTLKNATIIIESEWREDNYAILDSLDSKDRLPIQAGSKQSIGIDTNFCLKVLQ